MANSSIFFVSFRACRQQPKASATASLLSLPSGYPLIVRPGRSHSAAAPPTPLTARSGLSAAIPHAWCSSVSKTISPRFASNISPFQGSVTIYAYSARGYHPGLSYTAPSGLCEKDRLVKKEILFKRKGSISTHAAGSPAQMRTVAARRSVATELNHAGIYQAVQLNQTGHGTGLTTQRPHGSAQHKHEIARCLTGGMRLEPALNFLVLFVSRQKEQQLAIRKSSPKRSLSPFQGLNEPIIINTQACQPGLSAYALSGLKNSTHNKSISKKIISKHAAGSPAQLSVIVAPHFNSIKTVFINNSKAASRTISGLRKKGVKKIGCPAVKKEILFEPERALSFRTVTASSFLFRPDRQFLAFFSTALNFLVLFVSRQKEQQPAIRVSYPTRSLSPFQGLRKYIIINSQACQPGLPAYALSGLKNSTHNKSSSKRIISRQAAAGSSAQMRTVVARRSVAMELNGAGIYQIVQLNQTGHGTGLTTQRPHGSAQHKHEIARCLTGGMRLEPALIFLVLFVSRQKEQQPAIRVRCPTRGLSPFQGLDKYIITNSQACQPGLPAYALSGLSCLQNSSSNFIIKTLKA